jgi:diguanylate cyclase (GGDEF)-like protein/PAS domain S-box-containing protein
VIHNQGKSRRHDQLGQWENEGGSLRLSPAFAGRGITQYNLTASALLDAFPMAVLVTDPDGVIIYCNPAGLTLYGASRAQMLGVHWCQTIDPRDHTETDACRIKALRTARTMRFDARIVDRSGQLGWTRQSIGSLPLGDQVQGCIHTIEDVSSSKAAELDQIAALESLSRECERARVTLECIGDAVISTDIQCQVTYMNTVAEKLTGWNRQNAISRPFSEVFKAVDSTSRKPASNPAQRAMDMDTIVELAANCRLLRPDGSELEIEDSAAPILDSAGQAAGAVVIFRDSRFSQTTTSKMSYLAKHDALTGLANRVVLKERFEHALNAARQGRYQLAVLFIDLDNFKQINDTEGHKAGDRMLTWLAQRMTECVRMTDTVCRYGGDEFVVVLSQIRSQEDVIRIARKMQAAAEKYRNGAHSIDLGLSIGISLYPTHGKTADTLLRHADTAMYQAKTDKHANLRLYDPKMLGMQSARKTLV